MKLLSWLSASAFALVLSGSLAYAKEAGSTGGICISPQAEESLKVCPAGVTQFTPKDNKPHGVKIGQVVQQNQNKKGNKPGDPTVSIEDIKTLRGRVVASKVRQLL